MAIDRPQAIDDAPVRAGAQRRMAAEGLSCPARNGRASVPRALFLARGREPRGRKSRRRHCGKAIEAPAVLGPDHAIDETARVACQTAFRGEDVVDMGSRKRRRSRGEGTETLAYRKAPGTPSRFPAAQCSHQRLSADGIGALDRSAAGIAPFTTNSTADTCRTPNRRHDEARLQRSLAADAAGNGDLKAAPSPARSDPGGPGCATRTQAGRIKPNR